MFNVSVAQLQSFNPDMNCNDLQIGYSVCVVPGQISDGTLSVVVSCCWLLLVVVGCSSYVVLLLFILLAMSLL